MKRASSESVTVVVAAIVGDVAVAIAKSLVAAFTGSPALLSEAIHSLVDAINDGLLLFGIHRSRKRPDLMHPFGYGRELYFWTLAVGVLIFAVGGGVSVYEGILRILHPTPTGNPAWSYAILGASALFDGASWYFGWKVFRRERRGRSVFETIHASKDAAIFSVMLENSAALLGLLFAFLGVFLAHSLGMPSLEGVASLAIGVLLCVVAVIMISESQSLLVGEGVEKTTLEEIRSIVRADPAVESCGHLLTVYLGPEEILLAIEIRFHADNSAADIRHAIGRLKQAIQARHARIRRIYFDADSLSEVDPLSESASDRPAKEA